MNKLNNFKNQFSFFKTNLTNLPNLTQENKYLIAEIFFSIITLILIIIIILNKPSGGSGLNNIIVGIIGLKYPFIEAILNPTLQSVAYNLSEYLFYFLDTILNLGYSIYNILNNIFYLIIEQFTKSLMPNVVYCDDGVELIRVFSGDLKDIKISYCSEDLIKHLSNAVDNYYRTSKITCFSIFCFCFCFVYFRSIKLVI
jgi:hypothetical protein